MPPITRAQKKIFELKSFKKKKKKICNRASNKPTDSKKQKITDGKPNIKPTVSPIDYKGSKPTDSPKKKKTQYTLQITKANLKTKMSTEQHCNTSQ